MIYDFRRYLNVNVSSKQLKRSVEKTLTRAAGTQEQALVKTNSCEKCFRLLTQEISLLEMRIFSLVILLKHSNRFFSATSCYVYSCYAISPDFDCQ